MLSVACALACLALAFPTPAARVQNRMYLTANDVLSMPGKTMAVTLHAPTPYIRQDKGATISGFLVNSALANKEDEAFSRQNALVDPSVTARELLANALRDSHGLQPRPVDTTPTTDVKPRKLAALHPDVDFVLGVRTEIWRHAWRSKLGYPQVIMEFQLVDVATGKHIAWMRCDSYMEELIRKNEKAPPFEALESDGGAMLRQGFSVMAARCARKFASQRLLISPDKMPQLVALAEHSPFEVPSQPN